MTNEPSAPEAGWYPTPGGELRFWDGTQWLALPEPDDTGVTSDTAAEISTDSIAEQSRDIGDAPETGAAMLMPGNRKRRMWIAISIAVVMVLALAGGGIAWKSAHDAQVVAEAEEAAAKVEADREAAATAAQKRADDVERAARASAVDGIEASVKAMAEGHASDGVIDGPILEASCSPLGGGSTDDLTESTTVFKCFVANKDNGDGTMSGYTYNATMNWSTGSYTYGLGPT